MVSAEPLVSRAGWGFRWLGEREPLNKSAFVLPFGVFSAPRQPLQCPDTSLWLVGDPLGVPPAQGPTWEQEVSPLTLQGPFGVHGRKAHSSGSNSQLLRQQGL